MQRIEHAVRSNAGRWLAAAALGWLPLIAHAQAGGTMTTVTGGHVWTQTGNTYGVGVLSGSGTFTTTAPAGSGTATTMGGGGAFGSTTVDNGPASKTTTKIPVGGGRSVPVDVVNKIPKANAAWAIGKAAARVAGPIGVGMALYDLASDLGYMARNDDGQPGIELSKMQPITAYSYTNPLDGKVKSGTDALTQCVNWANDKVAHANRPPAAPNQFTVISVTLTPPVACNMTFRDAAANGGKGLVFSETNSLVQTNNGTQEVAVSLQELEDAIASQSGWPSSATRALADAIKSGEKVDVQAPTVSGPASVPGGSSTKTEKAVDPVSGKPGTVTTTTNTTYQNTYNNTNVTVNQVDQSTKVWNFDDGTTRTDTGSETKEPEPPEDDCKKDPNRVECAELDTPEGEIPKGTVNLTYSAEQPFGGGSCPANKTMNLRGQTVTVINWAQWCDMTATYVRPLIILLATISAFFIVAMGRDITQ